MLKAASGHERLRALPSSVSFNSIDRLSGSAMVTCCYKATPLIACRGHREAVLRCQGSGGTGVQATGPKCPRAGLLWSRWLPEAPPSPASGFRRPRSCRDCRGEPSARERSPVSQPLGLLVLLAGQPALYRTWAVNPVKTTACRLQWELRPDALRLRPSEPLMSDLGTSLGATGRAATQEPGPWPRTATHVARASSQMPGGRQSVLLTAALAPEAAHWMGAQPGPRPDREDGLLREPPASGSTCFTTETHLSSPEKPVGSAEQPAILWAHRTAPGRAPTSEA